MKHIGKSTILPGLFNIPFPFLFAVPVIFNPIYIIPLILCPLVTTTVNYLVLMSGVLTVTVESTNTLPVLFSGYLSSAGHLIGVFLQLLNFIIALFIYYPFFKYHEGKIIARYGTRQEKAAASQPITLRTARLFSHILRVEDRTFSKTQEYK
jgi:PTS system cellobiose-specific IIC component